MGNYRLLWIEGYNNPFVINIVVATIYFMTEPTYNIKQKGVRQMTGMTAIGNKLKTLREESGLNQTQLAAFLEVDQSFISKCEKGERQLSVDALEKLGCLFGCSLSDLSTGSDEIGQLQFTFRAASINKEDLAAISDINRIALNLKEMRRLLKVV